MPRNGPLLFATVVDFTLAGIAGSALPAVAAGVVLGALRAGLSADGAADAVARLVLFAVVATVPLLVGVGVGTPLRAVRGRRRRPVVRHDPAA